MKKLGFPEGGVYLIKDACLIWSPLNSNIILFYLRLTGPSLDSVKATSSEFLSTQNTAMSMVLR